MNNGGALPYHLQWRNEVCWPLNQAVLVQSGPDQGYCVEFLCKTLKSHSASLSPTLRMYITNREIGVCSIAVLDILSGSIRKF